MAKGTIRRLMRDRSYGFITTEDVDRGMSILKEAGVFSGKSFSLRDR